MESVLSRVLEVCSGSFNSHLAPPEWRHIICRDNEWIGVQRLFGDKLPRKNLSQNALSSEGRELIISGTDATVGGSAFSREVAVLKIMLPG